MTQQHLSSHVGRIRHMASIYEASAAFAGNLEVWACSIKQLSHHIRMMRSLKNHFKLAIWCMKRAADCDVSFDQFLKPMDIPDIYCSQMQH